MRDFGKVHTTIWSSSTFREMSEDGRALAMYLLTCPHGTIAGVFRLPDGYACEDLQWSAERVQAALSETLDKGFANRCETTKWVWINKHFEWNRPENPNQRKAAEKVASQIPSDCSWKSEFIRECASFLGVNPQPLDNHFETLSESGAGAGAVTGEGIEDTSPSGSVISLSADRLPACPHQSIADLYNRTLPELPAVRLLSDRRKRAIGSFWRWVLTSKKSNGEKRASDAAEAQAWIGEFFDRARDNDFLMGRTQRSAEHAGWQCDFDFLMSEKGRVQVIEKTKVAA